MSSDNKTIWLLVAGFGFLVLLNGVIRGAGSAHVRVEQKEFVRIADAELPEGGRWVSLDEARKLAETGALGAPVPAAGSDDHRSWTTERRVSLSEYRAAAAADPTQTEYRHSWTGTIGIWFAAIMTLFVFSFLYGDNPLYKTAEALVVGVSAAYWMVVGFWSVIVPNVLGKLVPDVVRAWSTPGMNDQPNYVYIIPLILGAMLLMRLSPVGSWIARWPLAFIIGTTAGLRLINFLHADFLAQIRNSIVPLWAVNAGGEFLFWDSIRSLVLVIGILSCVVYFFFTIEHKGVVGKVAKLGIWFLMITFGAAFGYTVMGRIALLAIRLEFLFDDWLWLIDPSNNRLLS